MLRRARPQPAGRPMVETRASLVDVGRPGELFLGMRQEARARLRLAELMVEGRGAFARAFSQFRQSTALLGVSTVIAVQFLERRRSEEELEQAEWLAKREQERAGEVRKRRE